MNQLISDIEQLLQNPEQKPTQQWVEQALYQYPYFLLPLQLYLQRHGYQQHEQWLSRLAIASPDRERMAELLGGLPEHLVDFYPPEQATPKPSTTDTIDRFLDTFGNTSQKEIDALNQAIFNPTPDYAEVLLAQEKGTTSPQATSQQDSLIDRFIASSQAQENTLISKDSSDVFTEISETQREAIAQDTIKEHRSTDDSTLSESLARSYIADRKYDKALEMIERLNLNYPEKSVYFADQMRFLRKVIRIQNATNKR